MKHEQLALFQPQSMPAGFRYAPDLIDAAEEARLVAALADLPFKEFEFHGFLGKRRVVSFGFRYDFNGGGLTETEPMPPFLLPVRGRAAAFAGLTPDRLQHVLITEYRPGAAIGWHRDPTRLDRRSVYLMRGPSRDEWEHSIPAVDALRYSITFRSMREKAQPGLSAAKSGTGVPSS
jgi:alkylated DNA repair dioxygenase AlkB